jgi:lysozyme
MDQANAVNIILPFTAKREGFSPGPYLDAGSYAIGYGNHYYEDGSQVTYDDSPITRDRAQQLMGYVLNQVAGSVVPLLRVEVSDNMLAALTDLAYNWGVGNLGKSILLQRINSGSGPDDIAEQWKNTAITSQGVYSSDLADRRVKEANIAFSSGGIDENTLGIGALVLAGAFILLFVFTAKKSR